jgi:hypothetical protein
MITSREEDKIIKKRCEGCKDNFECWQDFEIGVWRKKELKCEDIRKILEEN